jgi:LemA protein
MEPNGARLLANRERHTHIARARVARFWEVIMIGWILLALVVVAIFWVVGLYNKLVGARNNYKNAFAQIDVQLTRRYDLIPNLVEIAKGYMKHERETLEAVIKARNAASSGLKAAAANPGDAAAMATLAGAEGALGATLGRMFALAEAYPDLKANQNMMQLSEELTSTENKVAFARQAYNDSVMSYNNQREMFPGSIIAGMFNFVAAQLLEISKPEAREAVKVSFT